MEIVKFIKDKSKEWNDFCLASNDAWFWHRADWIDYNINFKPELKSENLSFLVYKGDELIAVVPLVKEVYENNIIKFSFGGWAIPGPVLANSLDNKKREEVLDFIYQTIDKLAREYGVVMAHFKQNPLSVNERSLKINTNLFMRHGFLNTSINTLIIDLKLSEAELKNDLRRNHKRNIDKEKNNLIKFYTADNITKEIFNDYKEIHHKAAGRQTRPDITFAMMYDWLKEGLAFLATVEFENKTVGYEYYTIYKNNVYGFSAANDPDYSHLPIRHKLEWEAILWMKKMGYDFYEIGWQHYGPQLYDFPDEKLKNICHFKRGYGGFEANFFVGEKFYDEKYFLNIYQDRIKKYAATINKQAEEKQINII